MLQGRVGGRYKQYELIRTFRITQRELECGRPTRRYAEDSSVRNFKSVEKAGVRVSLRLSRGVWGKRCPKIAESRWRNHSKAGTYEAVANIKSLIEASARTMNDEHGWSLA